MLQSEASTAIFERFRTMWPSLQPSYAAAFSFDNDAEPEIVPFARVSIVSNTSEIWTLGPSGRQQRTGFIDVRLWTQADIGRKLGDQLVETVRAIYERKRFASGPGEDGVITHATSASELRRDRDGMQLWIVQTLTPFEIYGT